MSGAERPLRILVVDDDQVDRRVVERALREAATQVEIDELDAADAVAGRLARSHYDCIVLDHSLPGEDGVALVMRLREAGVATPILAVTGQSEELGAALVAGGASDYLPKNDITPARLWRRIRYAIRVQRAEESERALRAKAERALRARDEILAIVSHDLRNPLNAVSIAIGELADPELEPHAKANYVAAVRQAVMRADRLIRDLLDASRIEAGLLALKPAEIDVAALLAQLVREHELLAREAGMGIQLSVPEPLPRVPMDRDRVLQALANLVGNAIRHARGMGPIEIEARTDGDELVISVADHGAGIPAEMLANLFDRDWQAQRQRRAGAGLGLAIARGIVEGHGGRISARNRGRDGAGGGGAVFEVRLPAAMA